MAGSARSQRGRFPVMPSAMAIITRLKAMHTRKASFMMPRAFSDCLAPSACATATLKPMVNAMHRSPKSHEVVATTPIAAEALEPSWPTMAVSIYCITTEEIWARMAGQLS